MTASHLLGAAAALLSALMWAWSAILFRALGNSVSALALNLGKGIVALLCMGALLLTQPWISADARTWAVLAASGVLGIALGDTLYFLALVRLGPRVTLVVSTLIPVITALAAVLLFDEQLAPAAWLGLALTIGGVSLVLWEQAPCAATDLRWRSGLAFGILFVLASAGSILFTKIGVAELPSMQATFLRQMWAIAALSVWISAAGAMIQNLAPLKDRRVLRALIIAAFIGAFLGTWLSVAALKYTHAAVAAALNSTSPLFVLALAALWLKETVSAKATAGAGIAVAGVALYFLSIY